ncbi:hypothetical protein CL622_04365 [archaeon]|nr:hypothetical protein [archaeon]
MQEHNTHKIAEAERLDKAIEEFKAKGGKITVLTPQTLTKTKAEFNKSLSEKQEPDLDTVKKVESSFDDINSRHFRR